MADDEPHATIKPTEKLSRETIRLEDVRAVLVAKSRDGYGAQVREIIAKHGGGNLSDMNKLKMFV